MSDGASGRLRTLNDVDLHERRVFLRADLNVPIGPDGEVADASRIDAMLPTLERLLAHRCAVVVASHLGRPKGKVVPALSLGPVARALAARLGRPVPLAPAAVGPEVRAAVDALAAGELLLLENLRFDPREERDDPEFAAELGRGLDLLVDDAFGAVHRAHASVHALARLLPSVAGLLVEREVAALTRLLAPERPFVVVLGGAKVADKLAMLDALAGRADRLVVGGGMANTFLLAQGMRLGRSLVEPERVDDARRLLARLGDRLVLPTDLVVGAGVDDSAPRVVTAAGVGEEDMALDIGPASRERFAAALAGARTVFWNGPMGMFEREPYRAGTDAMARAVAALDAFTVVGGGDSVAALNGSGLADRVGHVSTGGGASLEFVEGRRLPGLAVLGYEPPAAA
jgi:phosphoglycerate kinase